jgi:DNA-directed RNA polymerase specialized sigma subunit|tara:strand:- start:1142 stop:1729 length:588 start_codon:yes stop_codon:yes gene_type:complete
VNNEEFEDLHEKLRISKIKEDGENELIMEQVAALYLNKANRPNYLNWLTENAKIYDMAKEIKRIQNCINKHSTQRLMLGIPKDGRLTQRVRLKKANLPLLKKGLCTVEQINASEYLFQIENLPSKKDSSNDLNEDLNNVLSPKEKLVVYLYFGFHTDDPKSLGQIANFMDVSRSAVEKMLKEALAKMEEHLQDFS